MHINIKGGFGLNYYNEIKNKLINNEVYKKVKDYSKNKNDLETYYEIGRLLIEAQGGEEHAKYGNQLIKEYSKKLYSETNLNYSERTLRRLRQFYLMFKDEKWSTVSTKLSWSHYSELLKLNNFKEIEYYTSQILNYNLSIRELRNRIKSKEYERLPLETKNKINLKDKLEVQDLVKNPIVLNNRNNYIDISEKILQKIVLEDIPSFLKELGNGFTFIDNEYKINLGDSFNYIDLLLFNIEYNCYVVVELKVTELKKEHVGQIEVYMNYIDDNLRKINMNKTIGIIICKQDNKYVIKYCSDKRIIARKFEII